MHYEIKKNEQTIIQLNSLKFLQKFDKYIQTLWDFVQNH